MHEMSIAQNLIRILEQEMTQNEARKLLRVKISYGRISAIVPEALQTAFQALTRQTPLEGAVMETREVPLKVRCRECATEFSPQDQDLLIMTCTSCGAEFGHEVISGKELLVEEIEVE